jgi:hypothetical protein
MFDDLLPLLLGEITDAVRRPHACEAKHLLRPSFAHLGRVLDQHVNTDVIQVSWGTP